MTLLNAVSWSSWTALQSDGFIYAQGNDVGYLNRAYAYKQFSSFIEPGMKRVEVYDALGYQPDLEKVAFSDGEKTVLIVVNNAEKEKTIRLTDDCDQVEIYVTDKTHNCEKVSDELANQQYTLSPRSITTFVFQA